MKYLGEKISVGNLCLYCNGKGRSFWSLEAVQAHMKDLNHCKILYENNEHEYADFYDFSADYADIPQVTEGEDAAVDPSAGVHLSEDGSELIFSDGKSVGHRSLSVYYKQKVKPVESRDSMLINSLITQYKALGWYEKDQKNAQKDKKDLFMKRKQAHDFKLGMQSNKLQRYFRKQIL